MSCSSPTGAERRKRGIRAKQSREREEGRALTVNDDDGGEVSSEKERAPFYVTLRCTYTTQLALALVEEHVDIDTPRESSRTD